MSAFAVFYAPCDNFTIIGCLWMRSSDHPKSLALSYRATAYSCILSFFFSELLGIRVNCPAEGKLSLASCHFFPDCLSFGRDSPSLNVNMLVLSFVTSTNPPSLLTLHPSVTNAKVAGSLPLLDSPTRERPPYVVFFDWTGDSSSTVYSVICEVI